DDVVLQWVLNQDVASGGYALQDYNFETPSADLRASVSGRNHYELYEYPGDYGILDQGEKLARIRLQETESSRILARGGGDCRAFVSGFRFDLTDHYRRSQNQPYLLTYVHHRATQGGDFRSGSLAAGDPEFSYTNTFECIPASTPFRPARV